MVLVRPRLTDFYGISRSQADLDFAIPFLDEDIPLYVDPFLLWKSPSLQDNALHDIVIDAANSGLRTFRKGEEDAAARFFHLASECEEIGLGSSKKRSGLRIGMPSARSMLAAANPIYGTRHDLKHVEELRFLSDVVGPDRTSDFACQFLKSFLIDYTIDQCEQLGIPMSDVVVSDVFDRKTVAFRSFEKVKLPANPDTQAPIVFVPKRWLRHKMWIDFDEYFREYVPKDDNVNPSVTFDRVSVLTYNRNNYGRVLEYVAAKETSAADCQNDPLFSAIPISSAKATHSGLSKIPTGLKDEADKRFEDVVVRLYSSFLYPELDFASDQSRTDSGVSIRDLVFYNNQRSDLTKKLFSEYSASQLVFEIKNVKALERDHINQLFRYIGGPFGRLGILVTRNPPPRNIQQNLVDLWSAKRVCILVLTDQDTDLMMTIFEGKVREPIDVVKRALVNFERKLPV